MSDSKNTLKRYTGHISPAATYLVVRRRSTLPHRNVVAGRHDLEPGDLVLALAPSLLTLRWPFFVDCVTAMNIPGK